MGHWLVDTLPKMTAAQRMEDTASLHQTEQPCQWPRNPGGFQRQNPDFLGQLAEVRPTNSLAEQPPLVVEALVVVVPGRQGHIPRKMMQNSLLVGPLVGHLHFHW